MQQELQYTEDTGSYWTSDLYTNTYAYSIQLATTNDSWFFYCNFRRTGIPIRPVYGDPGIPIESITLDKTELELEVGESAALTVTILPEDATIKDYTWRSGNEMIATVSPTGVVTAVSSGTTWILAESFDPNKQVECTVTVTYSVPEAVDLGLSVQWASFNLGAATPEGGGSLYSWGESMPKFNYMWNQYQLARGYSTGLTKYCTDTNYGYDGFTDDKTELDPEDDAATVNLGGKWRMPTNDEMSELLNDCSWAWTTRNSMNGYLVTGSNGNSIFLPAAGYRYSSTNYDIGEVGAYWTSSLYTNNPSYALFLYFEESVKQASATGRYYGFSVRPVYGDRSVTTGGDIEGTEEEPWN